MLLNVRVRSPHSGRTTMNWWPHGREWDDADAVLAWARKAFVAGCVVTVYSHHDPDIVLGHCKAER